MAGDSPCVRCGTVLMWPSCFRDLAFYGDRCWPCAVADDPAPSEAEQQLVACARTLTAVPGVRKT